MALSYSEPAIQALGPVAAHVVFTNEAVASGVIWELIAASQALDALLLQLPEDHHPSCTVNPYGLIFDLMFAPLRSPGINPLLAKTIREDMESNKERFSLLGTFIMTRFVTISIDGFNRYCETTPWEWAQSATLALALLNVTRPPSATEIMSGPPSDILSPFARLLKSSEELGRWALAVAVRFRPEFASGQTAVVDYQRRPDFTFRKLATRDQFGRQGPDRLIEHVHLPFIPSENWLYAVGCSVVAVTFSSQGPRPQDTLTGHSQLHEANMHTPMRFCSGRLPGGSPCPRPLQVDLADAGTCGRCESVWYCSSAHQAQDWSLAIDGHRFWCERRPKEGHSKSG